MAKDLIRVIRDHQSSHFALTMDLADLKAVWPENGDDPLSFAYNVLMKFFMLDIGETLEREAMHERIDFVVERGPGIEPMLSAYKHLMADPNFRYKRRFCSIRVGSWGSDILLQVADLFSYEAYKDALRRADKVDEPRHSMAALLDLDSVGIKTQRLPREAIAEIKRRHEESVSGTKVAKYQTATSVTF